MSVQVLDTTAPALEVRHGGILAAYWSCGEMPDGGVRAGPHPRARKRPRPRRRPMGRLMSHLAAIAGDLHLDACTGPYGDGLLGVG
jgi:hypothetical protein